LLLPGIQYAEEQVQSKTLAILIVIAGLILGAVVLALIHLYAPHEHFFAGKEGPEVPLR